jgi:hypothetical protein
VLLIWNDNSFSPQNSSASVLRVRAVEAESLKMYFTSLVTFWPLNPYKFYIELGLIEKVVDKQGLIAVKVKLWSDAGASLGGEKL